MLWYYKWTSRISLLLLIVLTISCKSKKRIPTTQTEKSISEILEAQQSYEWQEAKARLNYRSEIENFKGTLNSRIRRDSAMLLAVKKIGIEGARTLITKDSLTHIDRINHEFYIKSISELSYLDIIMDYSYLEQLLAGSQPILTSDQIIDSTYMGDLLVINTTINAMAHQLKYNKYNGLLTELTFKDRFSLTASMTYDDYRLVDDYNYFPYRRVVNVDFGNGEKLTLELNYLKIETNIPKAISINIPKSYNRTY